MRIRRFILGPFWLAAGTLLALWAAGALRRLLTSDVFEPTDGPVVATAVGLGAGIAAGACGAALLAGGSLSRRLLPWVSGLAVLYGGVFLAFGGYHDRGGRYAAVVALLAAAGLLGLVPIRRPGRREAGGRAERRPDASRSRTH
jgi:hypothetical protein